MVRCPQDMSSEEWRPALIDRSETVGTSKRKYKVSYATLSAKSLRRFGLLALYCMILTANGFGIALNLAVKGWCDPGLVDGPMNPTVFPGFRLGRHVLRISGPRPSKVAAQVPKSGSLTHHTFCPKPSWS